MTITKQKILQVADAIDAAGINPTIVAVRDALGSGSHSTISPVMKEWRAKKAAKNAPIQVTAPQTITDLLCGIGSEVWSAALELANGRLSAEREALEVVRRQLEAERAEAAELADHLSIELESMKATRSAQDADLTSLRKALEDRDAAVGIQTQSLASASARLEEVTTRANQLNDELARVGAQNAELIGTVAQMAQAGRDRA
jgi:Plasmid replication region DNA-binding N-term